MRLCELLLTLCVYMEWRSLSLIAAPPWQTLILGSAFSVTQEPYACRYRGGRPSRQSPKPFVAANGYSAR